MTRPLVTVKTLLAQLRDRGRIELPADALVTPAAEDWLRGARAPITRTDEAAAAPTSPAHYLVGDHAEPFMQTLLASLQRQGANVTLLSCYGHRAGLMTAIKRMCGELAQCSLRRGVVVVRNTAIPCCVANKHPHIRAAVVTQPSLLWSLQHELGANVLVLERERTSLHQARAIVESFLREEGGVDPVITEALTGLATDAAPPPVRCGG